MTACTDKHPLYKDFNAKVPNTNSMCLDGDPVLNANSTMIFAIYPCQTSEGYACGGTVQPDYLGIIPANMQQSVNINNYDDPVSSYKGDYVGDKIFADKYMSRTYKMFKTKFTDDKSLWYSSTDETSFYDPNKISSARSDSAGKSPDWITYSLHGRKVPRYPLWYSQWSTGNRVTEVYRSYMKILTVLSLVGGLIRFVTLVIYVVYATYNLLMMEKFII